MNTDISTPLVQFVTKTQYEDIPTEVIEFSKALTLKTVAGMVAGAFKPVGRKMSKMVQGHKSFEEVRVFGSDFRTSLWEAVFLNAFLAHASELEDDRYNGGVSWDITVIPLLFPLAEKLKLSGKAFMEAIVIGLEAHTRTCSFGPQHLGLNVIPGAVGPALAAARALGLDAGKTSSALGIAMSGVPVSFLNFGTDAHFLESSLQALHGLMAAEMAKEGMSGNPDIARYLSDFIGKERVAPEKIVADLCKKWVLCEIWVKKYPCCFRAHRHVDILLELIKKHHLSHEDVEAIGVPISPSDQMLDRPEPKNEGDLQFSFQHILGAAMLDGDVTLDNINDDAVVDPRFRDARRKVKVIIDPHLQPKDTGAPACLTVTMKGGKKFTGERTRPIGSPQEPLTEEQYRELYHKFTRHVLTEEQIEKSAEAIFHLEKLSGVAELLDILEPRR